MVKIIFDGWEVGAKKISFTKLLKNKGGLTLDTAKTLKDRLINNNEIIEIEVQEENLAKDILNDAEKMLIKGRILK